MLYRWTSCCCFGISNPKRYLTSPYYTHSERLFRIEILLLPVLLLLSSEKLSWWNLSSHFSLLLSLLAHGRQFHGTYTTTLLRHSKPFLSLKGVHISHHLSRFLEARSLHIFILLVHLIQTNLPLGYFLSLYLIISILEILTRAQFWEVGFQIYFRHVFSCRPLLLTLDSLLCSINDELERGWSSTFFSVPAVAIHNSIRKDRD